MKNYSFLVFAILLVFMVACGSDDSSAGSNESTADDRKSSGEIQMENLEKQQEEQEEKEEKEDNDKEYDEETGEGFVEGLGYVKTIGIGYNEEVGIDGTDSPLKPLEFGSMQLEIGHMEVAEIEPDEDSFFFNEDKFTAIIIHMEAENTSEEDIEFHPGNSVLVTDTGEQIEDSELLGSGVNGEYFGEVKKEGLSLWKVENEDKKIESVKMIINPPYDMAGWEDIGEEKRIEFEVVSYEEATERDGK